MKKILPYLLLILACLQNSFHAQTLIAMDCNPQGGDAFSYSSGQGVPNGSAGAGQLWDFSTYSFTPQTSAPTTMSASSTVPSSSIFPNATVLSDNHVGQVTYFNASSDSLQIVGYVSNIYTLTRGKNPETILIYPFSLGNSTTDSYTNVTITSSQSYSETGTKTITADGTGTLITPAGTFNNVLRVRVLVDMPTGGHHIEDNYYWYAPGVHADLFASLSATYNIYNSSPPYQGGVQSSRFLNNAAVYLGVNSYQSSRNEIKLFPNPATDELNFELTTQVPSNFSIINPLGEILLEERSVSNDNVQKIDISTIKSGLYMLEVKSNNKIIAQKKFIVVK